MVAQVQDQGALTEEVPASFYPLPRPPRLALAVIATASKEGHIILSTHPLYDPYKGLLLNPHFDPAVLVLPVVGPNETVQGRNGLARRLTMSPGCQVSCSVLDRGPRQQSTHPGIRHDLAQALVLPLVVLYQRSCDELIIKLPKGQG